MSHVLAILHGLEKDIVESMLHEHTKKRTLDGLHLEHIWTNAEDDDEVVFLFKTDDMKKAHLLMDMIHKESQKHNYDINPPEIIYLKK